MKQLDPMIDFVFKALFGKEDQTSKMLLIALLNDILVPTGEDKIESIAYLNPFNYKEFEVDKLSILDIKARTEKDEVVNIEVQVRSEDQYRKRSLYYWSKAYAETIQEAQSYDSLKKTIAINIMGYNAINESEKIHTTFKILEENEHFILLEDLQIHYLELPKLPDKEVEEFEGVELWLSFLKEAGKDGNESKMNKFRERGETMNAAINKLEEISADERMRELNRAREKSRLDMISQVRSAEKRGLEQGLERGLEQGLEQGLLKSKIAIAKKLMLIGLTDEQIAEGTGLTIDEVRQLRQ